MNAYWQNVMNAIFHEKEDLSGELADLNRKYIDDIRFYSNAYNILLTVNIALSGQIADLKQSIDDNNICHHVLEEGES